MSDIPDGNLFMICTQLRREALRELPSGYRARLIRPDELDVWMAMPFDSPEAAKAYRPEMERFYRQVYAPKGDLFYRSCLMACDAKDVPVATLFAWKAYDAVWTLHWFKVRRECEGAGIGRGLLSVVMAGLPDAAYPVYLHTQPSSFRAIHLYEAFGFAFLTDPVIGGRRNDLEASLPVLRERMGAERFGRLRMEAAPRAFLDAADSSEVSEF